MKKSKLITLFKTFSKDEMKEFGKFLSSQYFSTGRNIKPLYNLLCKFHPLYNASAFTEEKIFRRLYPGKKFNEKKSLHAIHVQFSEIYSQAEKFLVFREVEQGNDGYAYFESLSSAYNEKGLHELALKAMLKSEEVLNKTQSEYFKLHKKVEFLHNIAGFYFYKNLPIKGYEYSEKILLYAVADFIRVLGRFADNHLLFKDTFNLTSTGLDVAKQLLSVIDPAILQNIAEDENEIKNVTYINYFLILSLLNNNDKTYLNKAASIYTGSIRKLSNINTLNLFFMIFSRQCGVLKNDISYIKAADKFFEYSAGKLFLKQKSNHILVASFYEAELKIKSALYDDEKISGYAKKYLKFVESDKAKGMSVLSNCLILLKQKKHNECLKLISNYTSLNGISHNDFYRLKSFCLYELIDSDGLIAALNAFEKYSRNNKSVSVHFKTENLNFIKAVKLLFKMKNGNENSGDIEKVTELIRNNIFFWWFSEKLNEISCKKQN